MQKKKIKVKKENLTEYLMMSKIALDMMTLCLCFKGLLI